MPAFSNDAINRANLHSAVQALAAGAGGSFVFVFLVRSGLSVPQVLATLAAITASRFVLRPAVLPLGARIGLRRLLMLGTVGEAAVFPMLPHLHAVGPLLFVMVAASSAASVLYWTSYHAYFAAMGDAEARGGQIGARELLTAAAMTPALMARVYNLAQASPCPLRFHIATEGGWDLGCGAGCLAAAAIAAAGLPLGLAVLVGLPGAALACRILVGGYSAFQRRNRAVKPSSP